MIIRGGLITRGLSRYLTRKAILGFPRMAVMANDFPAEKKTSRKRRRNELRRGIFVECNTETSKFILTIAI
jgi:hypothetical protein